MRRWLTCFVSGTALIQIAAINSRSDTAHINRFRTEQHGEHMNIVVIPPRHHRGARSSRKLSAVSTLVLTGALALTGCTSTGSLDKQALGTGLGAVVGAAAGAAIADGNPVLGAVAGGAIGGLIGNRVGAYLDEQDKRELATVNQRVLVDSPDGEPTTWKSERSGAAATVTPSNSRTEIKPVPIVMEKEVVRPVAIDLIGKDMAATANVNVRRSPDLSAPVATGLKPGDVVHAVGHVQGAPWIMVARDGKSIGYEDYLTEATSDTGEASPMAKTIDLDALDSDLEVAEVPTSLACRDLTTDVSSAEGKVQETRTACKQPDGSWELL
jgi:surface antigen